ncbi:MAG: SLC13 family permease [Pseudomonadota bacterium]|nr:SLC13 family permease [Pseudomonadota bacterium]
MDQASLIASIILLTISALFIVKQNVTLVIWLGVTAILTLPLYVDSFGEPIIQFEQALNVLMNKGLLTIIALLVVASGLKRTGALAFLLNRLISASDSKSTLRLKLISSTATLSGFFNNTPLVAALVPYINQFSYEHSFNKSHLMMPVSFAAILGGSCTLIGTNTNLILDGWLVKNGYHDGFRIFEFTPIVLPIIFIALIFLFFLTPLLIPKRKTLIKRGRGLSGNIKLMKISEQSTLIGKTILQAGLRGLETVYLFEIKRGDQYLTAVSSNVILNSGDILVFVGDADSENIPKNFNGLVPLDNNDYPFNDKNNRIFAEAVITEKFSLLGKSIKDSRFRTFFGAAIVAVAREGHKLDGKLGEIIFRPGDILLLIARKDFLIRTESLNGFLTISKNPFFYFPNRSKTGLTWLITIWMFVSVLLNWIDLFSASLIAAATMVFTGCCDRRSLFSEIDWSIIATLGGLLIMGEAVILSGLSDELARIIIDTMPSQNSYTYIAMFFLLSSLASNILSAKAGVLLILPVAVSITELAGLNLIPIVLTIMIAGSTALCTPLSYPTNLMVFGPGSYFFSDYIRLGLPITIVTGIVSTFVIPLVFLIRL